MSTGVPVGVGRTVVRGMCKLVVSLQAALHILLYTTHIGNQSYCVAVVLRGFKVACLLFVLALRCVYKTYLS